MRNVNAGAAISLQNPLSNAAGVRGAPVAPANKARGPLLLLKGGASAHLLAEAPGVGAASDVRTGPIARGIRILKEAMTTFRANRAVRKDAAAQRMADKEMAFLSNHILKDIGLSEGRIDAALRDASLHGPRL